MGMLSAEPRRGWGASEGFHTQDSSSNVTNFGTSWQFYPKRRLVFSTRHHYTQQDAPAGADMLKVEVKY